MRGPGEQAAPTRSDRDRRTSELVSLGSSTLMDTHAVVPSVTIRAHHTALHLHSGH
jgi:hypothetical protein